MIVAVTGSEGRMGRVVKDHLLKEGCQVSPVDIATGHDLTIYDDTWANVFGISDCVIHLAAPTTDGYASFEQGAYQNTIANANVLKACDHYNVPRVVLASSIWADHRTWNVAPKKSPYAASKEAAEALLEAWSNSHPADRIAIALRFGFFRTDDTPGDDIEETQRLTDAGLRFWIDRALAEEREGYHCWYAMGRL